MCDLMTGLAVGGAAAQGVGGIMRGQQNAAYTDAVNRANKDAYAMSKAARVAELARQAGFDTQAASAVDGTIASMSTDQFNSQAAQSNTRFMDDFDAATGGVAGILPPGMTASGAVMEDIARRTANETAAARERVKALAALQSYGAASSARGLTLSGNADKLSGINNLRRGSLNVSQQEQNIGPTYVMSPDGTMADIISGFGALASAYPGYIH